MIRALFLTCCLMAAHTDSPPANSGGSAKDDEAQAAAEKAAEKAAAKAAAAKAAEPAAPKADPLIKTVSEVAALSPKKQQAFRAAGGTAIEDPA
jgi:hypothetical protein